MKKTIPALFAALLLLFSFSASAMEGEWRITDEASARLIATDQVGSSQLLAGLHLRLKPNWHAYWRSPGDAGLPPKLDWAESENLGRVEILYPTPKKEELQGLITYGYGDEIVFPLRIERLDPTAPLKLRAKANILVCADICIPAYYDLALDLPVDAETTADAEVLLKKYMALVPRVNDEFSSLSMQTASYTTDAKGAAIALGLANPPEVPYGHVDVLAEMGDGSTLPINTSLYEDGTVRAYLGDPIPLKDLAEKEIIFTLVDRMSGDAVEKKLKVANVPTGAVEDVKTVSTIPESALGGGPAKNNFGLMLIFALIGGLILNLMPCVLPVLALKSLSIIKHSNSTPAEIRLSFLMTAAGIMASFFVMALIVVGMKSAGDSVGWGVQFQHPLFLFFLIFVLLLFSFNLFGLFEIVLPRAVMDKLNWTHSQSDLTKDFLTGAFATLLATPCTAPFLGTAVGFALAAGANEIFVIFLALGAGLAAPYFLIAAFPKVATLLPKPGPWMNNLKTVLAIALAGTAFWLGYVLAVQFNEVSNKDTAWQPFNRPYIAEYVGQGKTVFVDVTAEWCLTCKFNKKTVLDKSDVQTVLFQKNVVLMRADWTKPDKAIEVFLKDYGRYGIPFNIIYGPAAPQGIPLPELLSKDAVLEALKKASG